MSSWYRLEDHTPVFVGSARDLMLCGDQRGTDPDNDPWRVAHTTIGQVLISTVFLGLDHQWGDGPPLLFETMVFGGAYHHECERYSTWDEAEAGHKIWCETVRTVRDWHI